MRRTVVAALMAATMLAGGMANAQDIVMRRPLPLRTGVESIPDGTTPTPGQTTPIPGAPTPSPVTPTPVAPTPVPTEKPTYVDDDPEDVADPGEPPFDESYDTYTSHSWAVGEWTGGGSCGQQGDLTRSVQCIRTVNDSSSGDAIQSTRVPDSYCVEESGDKPVTHYRGDKANCDLEITVTEGDFVSTCSTNSYRQRTLHCMQNGTEVDMSWCRANLTAGGAEPPAEPPIVYEPNYTSCQNKWKSTPYTKTCGDADINGPAPTWGTFNDYNCARVDSYGYEQAQQEDAACAGDGPKPANDRITENRFTFGGQTYVFPVPGGTCEKHYYTANTTGTSQACGGGEIARTTEDWSGIPNSAERHARSEAFCSSVNAVCCEVKYRLEGGRQYHDETIIIGFDGKNGNFQGDGYWSTN